MKSEKFSFTFMCQMLSGKFHRILQFLSQPNRITFYNGNAFKVNVRTILLLLFVVKSLLYDYLKKDIIEMRDQKLIFGQIFFSNSLQINFC